MLPAAHRLRDGADFRSAVRRGRRAGLPTLVVHLQLLDETGPIRVGFVVSKAVGPAVVRNRVKRRLRHLVRERLTQLPSGALLVVRALPTAAEADYARLGADLDKALSRVGSTR